MPARTARLTPAQRRLVEALRQGQRLRFYNTSHGRYWLVDAQAEKTRVPAPTVHALVRAGVLQQGPGWQYEQVCEYLLSPAVLADAIPLP